MWSLARRSAQSRCAKLCLGPGCISRSSGVAFGRESCHAGRAASPSARCGALASPAASRGPGHHLLRLAAALQVAVRVMCTKVRLCAGLPGLFLGSPRPVSTVPPGLAAVPAVRGGLQGSLAGAAARLCFCSLLEESLRLALHMALPQAGSRRGRKGPGAGTGAAVTLLGDSVAWEHSGSCRCRWHTTAAR